MAKDLRDLHEAGALRFQLRKANQSIHQSRFLRCEGKILNDALSRTLEQVADPIRIAKSHSHVFRMRENACFNNRGSK